MVNAVLPDALSEDLRAEVERFVANLPAATSCVVTGSIVEGLGNPNSDLDLYLISEAGSPGLASAFGLRRSTYVDCEYLTLASLEQLCERVVGFDWTDVDSVTLKDIDRYYRLAIGVPVAVTAAAAPMLARFTKASAAQALTRHALLRTVEHLARAAYLSATGLDQEADLLLREAALWRATWRLAGVGEGYASVKWAGEKAARHYGRDSAEFNDLLHGYLRPTGPLDARIREFRSALTVPPELTAALEARSCRLAERVQVLDGGRAHLMKPGESIVRIDSVVASVCRELVAGRSWRAATDAAAASLGLAPIELRVALWCETQHLRTHGYLAVTNQEGCQ
jgi:predicted nucleotidyltransferase